MTKFWTAFAPVGRVMKRCNDWQHDKCSRCLSTNETSLYVLQCLEQSSRTQWETSLSQFEATLVALRTYPSIITVCKSRLLSWNDSMTFPFTSFSLGEKNYHATNKQDTINWKKQLMGKLSDYWEDYQQEWIVRTSTKRKRSSYTWMIKVIQAVWEISWKKNGNTETPFYITKYIHEIKGESSILIKGYKYAVSCTTRASTIDMTDTYLHQQ